MEGRIPEGKYSELLTEYVAVLKEKAPDAELIWGSTTQVHERDQQELSKEINPTIVRRNEMAAAVMGDERVTVNDLYGLMKDKLHFVRGDRFHWEPAGYEIMGKRIVMVIDDALTNAVGASSHTPDAGDDTSSGGPGR